MVTEKDEGRNAPFEGGLGGLVVDWGRPSLFQSLTLFESLWLASLHK